MAGAPNPAQAGAHTIYAAGFNTFLQLCPDAPKNIRTFIPFNEPIHANGITNGTTHTHGDATDILFGGWSTTAFRQANGDIRTLGFQKCEVTHQTVMKQGPPDPIKGAVGDHDGVMAFWTESGDIRTVLSVADGDGRRGVTGSGRTEQSPSALQHIALSGNGRVVVALSDSGQEARTVMREFDDFEKLFGWYQSPHTSANLVIAEHAIAGSPKQLLANIATFLVLTTDGEVYSWGDPRHQSLGRAISGPEATTADRPGIIDALQGLTIVKIASGGWVSAALSADGAAYLWGAAMMPGHQPWGVQATPENEQKIRCLDEAGAGKVVLIEIMSDNGEPADAVDIAIGDGHAAVVTAHQDGNRLYVLGYNKYGQLGLGSDAEFIPDWTEVPSMRGAQRVVCGSKATFCFLPQASSP
jgi:hypothetical protein